MNQQFEHHLLAVELLLLVRSVDECGAIVLFLSDVFGLDLTLEHGGVRHMISHVRCQYHSDEALAEQLFLFDIKCYFDEIVPRLPQYEESF